ncbi:UvrD-helicase domain-containing protein [Caproiciproducens sp.]|uniref:UvrD-helicase domain-containing protein n=1 Tax=Caproiciproducens sp. TaxID=1954376 RepID=UPI00289F767D|nr:UvrD-helicase domain-containing protein [Caproiciproducens sp.]
MFIADFHIHSKYSRATSRDCIPEMLELWARRKGLDLIGTGDFTHPAWREELREKLVPAEEGLYTLKDGFRREDGIAGGNLNPRFMISGEISSIYKKNGKVRKVHNLILLPGLESAEALSHRLEAIGNLHSDGRPILGLDSRDLLEITLDVCPDAIFIPAHIWTPHFSLFGAYSGFDDIEECFGDLTGRIHALETGLSSDPPMNWRISALDRFTLVSNSDAHSPANLAREANIFDTGLSYPDISRALQNRDTKEFSGTIEFFPEEGKYHYDGHRNCGVCLKPADTLAASGVCPVCGGRITVGVLHRVESLADRKEGFVPRFAKHFESLVPLREVIAASVGLTAASKKVGEKYEDLIRNLGPELFILRKAQPGDIELAAGPLVAEGIRRLRDGKVTVLPGFDGEYGKIKILDQQEIGLLSGQLCLFKEKRGGTSAPGNAGKRKKQLDKAPVGSEAANTPSRKKGASAASAVGPDAFSGLNQEQREAVSASDPAVAVIAGPGTGKTRTLVSRIVRLVRECGASPAQITAVTFTNRAADEMRSRLAAYFGDRRTVRSMHIGTFHSICLQTLSGKNGDANPTIIDEQDALSILADLLKDLRLKTSPRDVLKGISLIKSGARLPEEDEAVPPGVYDRYCGQLLQYGVLDYDDILLNTLKLFESGELGNREEKKLRNAFSHLLVDEFQDINPVQYRLIREWGKNSAGIFVIGDPDQSIYGFRGSDSRCFDRFLGDYPGARQIRLTQNYRSTPEIIGCARSVLAEEGTAEPPFKAQRDSGVRVRLLEADGDLPEAIFIAKEINRMVGGIDMLDAHTSSLPKGKKPVQEQTRSFSDIAVLYRTNRQAELLEQCLRKEGIPYLVAGRDDFLSDHEVRKTVAFFRFLLDPADLISLRLCLKEWEVCPGDRMQRVLEDYAGTDKSISSVLALLEKFPASPENPQKFSGLLRKYEPLVRSEKPQKLIEAWIDDNGLQEVRSMELFLNMAVLHEKMPSLLQNLLLGREGDVVRSGGKIYSPDAVSLMTLHASKGLEFPVVFMSGIKDGVIPLKNRRGDCDPDEERRLFYVGMTRGQDELVLLTSSLRSPFLSGLPTDLLSEGTAFERKKAPEFEQVSFF